MLLFPLYAAASHVVVLGAITAVIYFTEPIFNAVVVSYRLGQVPGALQGWVNSAARMLIFMFQPPGAAISGLLERLGGRGPWGFLGSSCWGGASGRRPAPICAFCP